MNNFRVGDLVYLSGRSAQPAVIKSIYKAQVVKPKRFFSHQLYAADFDLTGIPKKDQISVDVAELEFAGKTCIYHTQELRNLSSYTKLVDNTQKALNRHMLKMTKLFKIKESLDFGTP